MTRIKALSAITALAIAASAITASAIALLAIAASATAALVVVPPAEAAVGGPNGSLSAGATPALVSFDSDGGPLSAAIASAHTAAMFNTSLNPPSAQIPTPSNNATYRQNQVVYAKYSCAEDAAGPGLQSCSGPATNGSPIDTSNPGPHTFTVTATSKDGQIGTATVRYDVFAPGDRIYYSGGGANKIRYAYLDGSGGGDLSTGTATVNNPYGVAIDTASGRIYWANETPSTNIAYARLDGSGGGDLSLAHVDAPQGLTLDPLLGRMLWANKGGSNTGSIGYAFSAGVNFQDGGPLAGVNTAGFGLTADYWHDRVYFVGADSGGTQGIMYTEARSGGPPVTIAATPSGTARGVALDSDQKVQGGPVGRIFWANRDPTNKISYAKLDGPGGGNLNTGTATVNGPRGVAIDPAAGRIYWANEVGGKISFANLDGSGGGDLTLAGTPEYVAILEVPRGTGAPTISGGSALGSTLSCSQGSWAYDLIPSFLYRAPRSFAYKWSLNGADISGANQNTYRANSAGQYRCTVTAANDAGTSSQTSAPVTTAGMTLLSALTLTNFTQSARRWRTGKALPRIAAKRKLPIGTTFSFMLNEPATVSLTFARLYRGRNVGGKCVAQTRANQHKAKCIATATAGTLRYQGQAGANALLFEGRLSKMSKLRRGSYKVTAIALDAAGRASPAESLRFAIVRK